MALLTSGPFIPVGHGTITSPCSPGAEPPQIWLQSCCKQIQLVKQCISCCPQAAKATSAQKQRDDAAKGAQGNAAPTGRPGEASEAGRLLVVPDNAGNSLDVE